MAKASFHMRNSTKSALLHNNRVFSVEYAIDTKERNDIYSYASIDDSVELAENDYQKYSKNHRRIPRNAQLIKEAIVNLNENHTLEDVQKLCGELKKKFGY